MKTCTAYLHPPSTTLSASTANVLIATAMTAVCAVSADLSTSQTNLENTMLFDTATTTNSVVSAPPQSCCAQLSVAEILQHYRIRIPHDNTNLHELETVLLPDLDNFLAALLRADPHELNTAPGFYTKNNDKQWGNVYGLPYQTRAIVTNAATRLPLPSATAMYHVFQIIRSVLIQRISYLRDKHQIPDVCSCISYWTVPNSIAWLANQAIEQMMVEETSNLLKSKYDSSSWDALYEPLNTTTSFPCDLLYYSGIPVALLTSRDQYLAAFTQAVLSCTSSIQIMTCYLFSDDAAQQYVLFDLLPYVVRTRGVTVQLLIDSLPMESAVMKSVFYNVPPNDTSSQPTNDNNDPSLSFLNHLPHDAPAFCRRPFSSPAHFLQTLLDNQDIAVHFWCARDANEHFRVKNHTKCALFDQQAAIFGGSNLTPTVRSATADLDLFLAGPVVAQVAETFETLWTATTQQSNNIIMAKVEEEKKMEERDSRTALHDLVRTKANDLDCQVAILRSTPSSAGEDTIYRAVLHQIRSAQHSILVGMGHACFPKSFTHAIADAVQRGVTVQLLVNSLFSNDLRTGQGDLFRSIAYLLQTSPAVRVYATVVRTLENNRTTTPHFLHGKYVVIDSAWCAVGSWNLWTRSAFHEIEQEALLRSRTIAGLLSSKFARDRTEHAVLVTEANCGSFCPKGCFVCQGFGPFFDHDEESMKTSKKMNSTSQ